MVGGQLKLGIKQLVKREVCYNELNAIKTDARLMHVQLVDSDVCSPRA
jgi:hypothetical protein